MWLPVYLEHRYSKSKVSLGKFYLWWVWSAPHCLFFFLWLWVGSRFYSILEWLLQLVSSDHLLGKLFFSLSLWGSCLSFSLSWVSCKQQNVGSCLCSQYVSLCLFIVELSPLILRDIKEKLLLLPIIFVVNVGILFLWLSSFWFVEGLLSFF